MTKEFKTLNEQLELLKSRGLAVADDQKALDFLKFNNYYRVSGYSLTLRDHDKFNESASMQDIIDIYEFDHELRILILSVIEKIEVNIKSVYAYRFAEKHGPLGYKDEQLFSDKETYDKINNNLKKQIRRRLKDEAYLQHFLIELKEDIPIWAYVDLFTFSDISLAYQISDDELKKVIAKDYGLDKTNATYLMERFLHGLTIVRNFCAHESRLYNRLFVFKANLNKNDRKLLRRNPNGNPDNEKVFGHILVMRRLALAKDWGLFVQEMEKLVCKYPSVQLKNYGFPDNWKETISDCVQ